MPVQFGSPSVKRTTGAPKFPKIKFGSATTNGATTAAPATPTSGLVDAFAKAQSSGPSPAALSGLARGDATADTAAQVGAYRGEQNQILNQAAGRARQINAASIAAAKYLTGLNLGGSLASGLRAAAADQAGLAAGYSGQLQQTVGDETAQVQRGLDAIGGAGTAPNTSQQAGNVVYGVGGAIPASAMLAGAPYAEAAANAAPGQLLAYGGQEAIGALGAGRDAAAAYDPKIASAIGGAPALERKYLADYTKTAAKSKQDTISNLFKAVGVQQKDTALADARTSRTDKLAADRVYHQALLDAKTADRTAKAAYQQAQLDAKQAQADALAAYRQGQLSISEFNANTSRIRTTLQAAKLSQPNASLSRARGVLVDGYGNPIASQSGKPIVLPGFKVGAGGQVVKVSTSASKGTAATGGLSASSWRTLASDATKQARTLAKVEKQKVHYPAGGAPPVAVPGTGKAATSYPDALAQIVALGPATPAWQKKAAQIVNAQYPNMGKLGRPYEGAQAVTVAAQFLHEAARHNQGREDAIAAARATGLLPDEAILKAADRIWKTIKSGGTFGVTAAAAPA